MIPVVLSGGATPYLLHITVSCQNRTMEPSKNVVEAR